MICARRLGIFRSTTRSSLARAPGSGHKFSTECLSFEDLQLSSDLSLQLRFSGKVEPVSASEDLLSLFRPQSVLDHCVVLVSAKNQTERRLVVCAVDLAIKVVHIKLQLSEVL